MDGVHEADIRSSLAQCPDGCEDECKCAVWRCPDVKALVDELDVLRRELAEYVVGEEP